MIWVGMAINLSVTVFVCVFFALSSISFQGNNTVQTMLPHYGVLNLDILNWAEIELFKSKTLDLNGFPYYFLGNPRKDWVSRMIKKGQYENNLNMLFRHLWESEVKVVEKVYSNPVIDVGVNYGAFTMFAASLGARLYCFEMQPLLVTLVDISLRISGYKHNVQLFNVAISNQTGLNISFSPVPGNLGETYVKESRNEGAGTQIVTTRRIDELFRESNVFFMKLDIEGAEPSALSSMGDLIFNRKVKHIVVETRLSTVSMLEILYTTGYLCRFFDKGPHCLFASGIHSSCLMQTYISAGNMISMHLQKSKNRWAYVDVHCFLSNDLFNTSARVSGKGLRKDLQSTNADKKEFKQSDQ